MLFLTTNSTTFVNFSIFFELIVNRSGKNKNILTKNKNFIPLPRLVSKNEVGKANCLSLTDGSLVVLPYTIHSRTFVKPSVLHYFSVKVSRNDCLT